MRDDGKGAARAFDDGRRVEEFRNARAVNCRRHDEKTQIFAQGALRIERKRKPEIGVERALMELVEKHRAHAFERWVVEDHPGENAFSDDFDARFRRMQRFHPHAEADRLADFLAKRRRHPLRRRPRRKASGLEQQELATMQEGLVQ
jgi:hypothetical protein